jgi:hypothetical protein
MDEPLLRDHKVQERVAPDALAGKLHDSDPGAAPSSTGDQKLDDVELAALNTKNRTLLEKTNPPKKSEESPVWQEIIEKPPIDEKTNPCNKSEDVLLVRQEICKNLRQPKEDIDGPLNAEKKPPLTQVAPIQRQKEAPHTAEKKPKNGNNNNTDVSDGKILQKRASKAPVQGALLNVDALAEAAGSSTALSCPHCRGLRRQSLRVCKSPMTRLARIGFCSRS